MKFVKHSEHSPPNVSFERATTKRYTKPPRERHSGRKSTTSTMAYHLSQNLRPAKGTASGRIQSSVWEYPPRYGAARQAFPRVVRGESPTPREKLQEIPQGYVSHCTTNVRMPEYVRAPDDRSRIRDREKELKKSVRQNKRRMREDPASRQIQRQAKNASGFCYKTRHRPKDHEKVYPYMLGVRF